MERIIKAGFIFFAVCLFVILSLISVKPYYFGEWINESDTQHKINTFCPDNYLDHTSCCNNLIVFCVKFPFPCHAYTVHGAFESWNELKCFGGD